MSRPAQGFCSVVCAIAIALGGGCGPSRNTQDEALFDPHEACLAEQERLRAEKDEKVGAAETELGIIKDDLETLRRHAERVTEELVASRKTAEAQLEAIKGYQGLVAARDQEIRELKAGPLQNGDEDLAAQLLRQKEREIQTLRAEVVRLEKGEPRPDRKELPGIVKVAPDVDLDRPVADVDGDILTRRELAEYLYADLATRQLLDPFVNRHLVLRAAARAGMTVNEAEVEAFVVREVLEQIKRSGSEAAWLEQLAEVGFDRRGWESRLRYQARPMLLLGRLVERERETISGRAAFEKRIQALYEQAYSVRVSGRHILIAVPQNAPQSEVHKAQRAAEQVYQLLLQGHSFADLAQKYSQDRDTGRLGGYMGEFEREALADRPELEEPFFRTLPEGRPSQPIRTRLGFHLLLVDQRRTPQRALDESLRRELAERLRGEPATPEEQAAVINRLRAQARIRTMLGISND